MPLFKTKVTFLVITTAFLLLALLAFNMTDTSLLQTRTIASKLYNTMIENFISTHKTVETPSHMIHMMTKGQWKTRPLTKNENADILAFLGNAQARYRFPPNYQRKDQLCGNVTYIGNGIATWFRALCDPKGTTPCCYHNKCAMKSVEECVCKDCYDMRNMKHAEYSAWIPSDPGSTYKTHTPQEACDILKNMSIVFVGDSLVRHVYTAMLLVVTGNMEHGAISKSTDNDSRTDCKGMYMFTEKKCRLLLNKDVRVCGGNARLQLFYYYSAGFGQAMKNIVQQIGNNSFLFTGIGIHENFNLSRVQTGYLLPTLTFLKQQNRTQPKLLWFANHAPGILKSPKMLSQTYDAVKTFNSKMEPFLHSWNITIFDTFNLTDGMMSFDGEHYGLGMNVVKANILLSYLKYQNSFN